MKQIGFLGLGVMGSGMAANLIKAGYPVTVWNRTRAKAEDLAALGASVADTPRQAAEGKDVVITILANPAAVEEVVFWPDGVIESLKEGAVLIDCSTVDPATSLELAKAAEEKGAKFIDCPVGGSKPAAAAGELVLMVGGDVDVIESVRPILEVISKKIVHAGGAGMGTYLKLCFNLVVSHMAAALSETLILGTKAGLDPALILDTLNSGIVASKFYEWKGECIINRDFATNFALELMHKDLHLMMSAAYGLNIPLPVTAAVKELFGTTMACCDPTEDFSSVIRGLEKVTGVEVRRPGD